MLCALTKSDLDWLSKSCFPAKETEVLRCCRNLLRLYGWPMAKVRYGLLNDGPGYNLLTLHPPRRLYPQRHLSHLVSVPCWGFSVPDLVPLAPNTLPPPPCTGPNKADLESLLRSPSYLGPLLRGLMLSTIWTPDSYPGPTQAVTLVSVTLKLLSKIHRWPLVWPGLCTKQTGPKNLLHDDVHTTKTETKLSCGLPRKQESFNWHNKEVLCSLTVSKKQFDGGQSALCPCYPVPRSCDG